MTKPYGSLITANFSLPPAIQLQKFTVVTATISKMIAFDEGVDAFHHKMVHGGISLRYEFALAVAADRKAFVAFQGDERIKALARPPLNPADTLRSLFNATYGDPKKASKYFKRIEHLWEKRSPAKTVYAYLQQHGLSDPPPKSIPATPSSAGGRSGGGGDTSPAPRAAGGGNSGPPNKPAQKINKKDPPGGTIALWPGKAKAGQTYKLRVEVSEVMDDVVIFELMDVPQLVV